MSYLSGMLSNPSMGPNATVNRWIETILTKFHFTLRHVPGKTFAADGLSRRDTQPGDAIIEALDLEDNHIEPVKFEDLAIAKALYGISEEDWEDPLDFEDFRLEIDNKSGYLYTPAASVDDFQEELTRVHVDGEAELGVAAQAIRNNHVSTEDCHPVFQLTMDPEAAPTRENVEKQESYHEERRTAGAKRQDERLTKLKQWLISEDKSRPADMSKQEWNNLLRTASHFFVSRAGKMYRKNGAGNQLVVNKKDRMYMMQMAHDNLAHKGCFAT
ncbi:hypothetical protein DXG01_016647 [Tephrocybe rancida]|nr:hypothetical protein DXG01_016647 [Tephrocybe rancida]